MQATIFDVDTFFQDRLKSSCGNLGIVQRHKFAYMARRHGVLAFGKLPFAGRVEAWRNGPVFTALQKKPSRRGDPRRLSAELRDICECLANSQFVTMSGQQLSQHSHGYPEWQEARKGLRPTERGNREITLEMMGAALVEI